MENDLISRSALLEKSELIIDENYDDYIVVDEEDIKNAPAVDAVVMPEGKPGDYVEWDNGMGNRRLFRIDYIMICEEGMRYALSAFAPVVNHKNIVRIVRREEVEQKERREENAAD